MYQLPAPIPIGYEVGWVSGAVWTTQIPQFDVGPLNQTCNRLQSQEAFPVLVCYMALAQLYASGA